MRKFRLAGAGDAEELLAIYAPYVEKTAVSFEFVPPTKEEFEGRIRSIMEFFPYILCEENGEILGYAYAHRFHERAGFNWDAELSVYVKEGKNRKGIGYALYEKLIGILEKQGFYNLYALISVPNEPSVALHSRFGFETEAIHKDTGCKFGEWHDMIIMKKVLRKAEKDPTEPIPFYQTDFTL
ncbi:MAG: N-acetyltransferase [Christensenellaceae bacterium]|nr:N-acetyltransferase [Christensenellaceae bacterium]